jgi:hypothetical protein
MPPRLAADVGRVHREAPLVSTLTNSDCVRANAVGADPETLVEQLRDQLGPGPHALVVAFAAPTVDRATIARLLRERFPASLAVGCSTAGEIGVGGYRSGGAVALALSSSSFRVAHTVFRDVRSLGIAEGQLQVQSLLRRLAAAGAPPTATNTFALLLVDGLSFAEEALASMAATVLGDIPLAGGSAGDGLVFGSTHVFAGGEALPHGGVLVLVQTELPFEVFKTQHFAAGERRMVVTAAHCPTRTVYEIDGLPAAEEFARIHGTTFDGLGPEFFATHPLLVRVGGGEYVRSIQRKNADGSLSFFCAIEEGLVLRDAQGRELTQDLAQRLQQLDRALGGVQATIVFDCILRRLECERRGTVDAVSATLERARAVGFSTYGEQFHGIHINQTLTGIAIGARSKA